jgi:L-asparaginase / beta-aspartyl-peptidase
MIVVASSNGRVGIAEAMRVLKSGGRALDAVEAGVRLVEDNVADNSVGTGGLPNLLGEVELDASIMDGRTLAAGAVGSVRYYPNPISIARRVMDELPHCFLVGTGAERYAEESGFSRAELLTPEIAERYEEWLSGRMAGEGRPAYQRYMHKVRDLARVAKQVADPQRMGGTVNFLARDREGNIASAVSTSGWAWKYPGRLGDSPVIGAGNYCDNRYGAAACTGRGEMAIRAGTARSVVLYMKMGMSLTEALTEAQRDLWSLEDAYYGNMHIVGIDSEGNPGAASNHPATYIYQRDDMERYAEEPRLMIESPNADQQAGWSTVELPSKGSDRQ